MKRLIPLLLSLFLFAGCESDTKITPEPELPVEKQIVSFPDKSAVSLPKNGRETELTFIAYFEWEVEIQNISSGVAASHVTVSATSGKKGINAIKISAAENSTGKEITADIVFTADGVTKKIPFSQITENFIEVTDPKLQSVIVAAHDTNKDGEISQQEADAVEVLNCCGAGKSHINIYSLEGIEQFKNIKELNCNLAQLTAIDLSQNTKIERLDCSDNFIREIDLSAQKGLVKLNVSTNNLRKIDLSQNTSLETLVCPDNFISTLNIASCDKLQTIRCEYNTLDAIDISTAPELTYLSINDNYRFTKLDVSKNAKLAKLVCDYNKLTSLDVTTNRELVTLVCGSNPIEALDLSNNSKLEFISASSTYLTVLDVRHCPNIQLIYVFNNDYLGLLYINKTNVIYDIIYDKGLQINEVE